RELPVRAEIQVAGMLGVGEAEQVRQRVGILQRYETVACGNVYFCRVRTGEAARIGARVVIGVHAEIHAERIGELRAVAEVTVEFDAARDTAKTECSQVRQPADVAAPGAGVEATLVVDL